LERGLEWISTGLHQHLFIHDYGQTSALAEFFSPFVDKADTLALKVVNALFERFLDLHDPLR
jgi:hypothetical protein